MRVRVRVGCVWFFFDPHYMEFDVFSIDLYIKNPLSTLSLSESIGFLFKNSLSMFTMKIIPFNLMALDVYTHNIYTCIWVRRINVETMMMKEVWTKAKLTQQNKTNPFVSGAAHIGAKYRNLSACLFRDRFRCFLSLILQGFFIGKIFPEFVQFNTPQRIILNFWRSPIACCWNYGLN